MPTDKLADDLNFAAATLRGEKDCRFAKSLLDQHLSGRELSPKQFFYANELIKRTGRKPITLGTDVDVFGSEPTAPHAAESAAVANVAPTQLPAPTVLEVDLERCVAKVLKPIGEGLEQRSAFLSDRLEQNQARWQRDMSEQAAQRATKAAIDYVEKRKPREVVISTLHQDGSKWTSENKVVHPNFEKLLNLLSVRKDDGYAPGIFLAGERGSGKTTGCRLAAEALGLTWYTNGAISFDSQMLGYVDGYGKYHRTPFRDAFEHGGLYTFDEVDRSDSNALLAVNPHLANGEASFPDGMIKRHKDCLITATGNTWGLGGSLEFSGACKLDEAFLSRFEYKLPWDVDAVFERKLVANDNWYDYVSECRRRIREAGVKFTIDSRAAICGAKAIAQLGFTKEQAASITFLSSMKPDQRKIVEGLVA